MRHLVSQSAVLLAVLLLCIPAGRAADDRTAFRDALAALQRGDFRAAEQKLRSEVAANVNADLQLARQSLKRKNAAEALRYLKRLPAGQLAAPNVALVRLEALYLAGDGARADALAARLSAATQGDAGMSFSLGLALANSGRFDQAELLFARVLAVAPADFNILFNLGTVAASAGHYERAREVFETANR